MPYPIHYGPGTGPDDFASLRELGHFYVDKSLFIAELLRQPDQVLLLPRPRRFGKSLNLSMLRCWLERTDEDRSLLFDDLAISREPPEVQRHRGRYPVIWLTLKEARCLTWEQTLGGLRGIVQRAARPHQALLHSPHLAQAERAELQRLLDLSASLEELQRALLSLSHWLWRHHGEKAVILLDEYDAPIESGFTYGFYDEIIGFLRVFLGSAFKANSALYRGVLTGVRRVSEESLFSGLNNVRVCSLMEPAFGDAFGFTEAEVVQILAAAGRPQDLQGVRDWYNGYLFGGVTIYNPWSLLCYARDGTFKPYWVNTSSDELLQRLIPGNVEGLRGAFQTLMDGGTLEVEVDEHVVLRDLERNPGALWSFLLTAGYLKAVAVAWTDTLPRVTVAIPNREVGGVWRRQFQVWLELGLGGTQSVNELLSAVLAGDALTTQRHLGDLVRTVLSYHDTAAGPPWVPERVYQAFVLGMLVWLDPTHRVRSNRESGYGRADVLVVPRQPGRAGAVLEFKRLLTDEDEQVEQAIAAAREQIHARAYRAELDAAGASPVVELVVVFDGKKVWVRGGVV